MRTSLLVVALVGMFSAVGAAPALAEPSIPSVPSVPQNCHEWNDLLHIQNVVACDWDNG